MLATDANDAAAKPDIEEAYSSATHATNLKVEAHRWMPIDTVMAAGWSRSRVGAALLRLHSEHDGAEKPERPTPKAVEALAAAMKRQDAKAAANRIRENAALKKSGQSPLPELSPSEPVLSKARAEAFRWYEHERKLQLQKLKSLPDVRRELIAWCGRVGISGGEHKVPALIFWWLDPVCAMCDGRKFQLIPGTPSLSNKLCPPREMGGCGGLGELRLPYGDDGRKIERYIIDCLQAARASMRERFRDGAARAARSVGVERR